MAQRPRLVRSELTGFVYVTTRYKEHRDGLIEADKKFDVTADFVALARSAGVVALEASPSAWVLPDGSVYSVDEDWPSEWQEDWVPLYGPISVGER